MKKKILAVLFTVMLAGSLAACGNKDTGKLVYLKDFKAADYVTLGEYKGLELALTEPEITDEYVESYIQYVLANSPVTEPVTDRAVEMGDTVNIDYEGKLDGVAFDGGTAQGTDLTIGSGQFISGFEDGVVGMEIGETREVEATFPDPYKNNPDLSGKVAVFTVTVNSIGVQEIPELTDEYVAGLGMEDCSTVEEYRTIVSDYLLEMEMEQFHNQKVNAAVAAVEAGASFKEAPAGMVERMNDTLTSNISAYAQMYGANIGDYVASAYGGTAENYETTLKEQSALMAQRYIMLAAIADAEGIEVTDEEMNDQLAEEAANYGYASVEEYTAEMDMEAYREYLLTQEITGMLAENSVIAGSADETE